MIVITLGKNAVPGQLEDQAKYLQKFMTDFKAEFGYPVMYDTDNKLDGIKISFRFKGMNGIPLKIADKVLNRIRSAFNEQ